MRVLLVVPEMEEGGVERHVAGLAGGLLSQGHEAIVVSSGGVLVSALPDGVEHLTAPVHEKNPAVVLRCAAKIASFARSRGVEILHAHSRVPAWACWAARFSAPGVKFICTAHALYSLNFGLWPFSRADGVICVSRAVLEHLRGRLPEGAPTEVIYNALFTRVPPWRGPFYQRDVKRMICVGRLAPKKGLASLFEALAMLRRDDWRLELAGDGAMRDELKRRAAEGGISDKVVFMGRCDDVGELVAASDLFLFPSLEEGMGLALAEALECGLPILASDITAARELARGELVPPGDSGAWARAIGDFLDGASPALQKSAVLPSVEQMAEAVGSFYAKVVAGETKGV